MRSIRFLLFSLLALQLGCSQRAVQPPPYRPETFRADIKSLIDQEQYSAAVAFLNSADPKRQAEYDKQGYLAVGEDMIVLPGLDPNTRYNRSRDWFIPGTQDAIQDMAWQRTATKFAEEYNTARDANSSHD